MLSDGGRPDSRVWGNTRLRMGRAGAAAWNRRAALRSTARAAERPDAGRNQGRADKTRVQAGTGAGRSDTAEVLAETAGGRDGDTTCRPQRRIRFPQSGQTSRHRLPGIESGSLSCQAPLDGVIVPGGTACPGLQGTTKGGPRIFPRFFRNAGFLNSESFCLEIGKTIAVRSLSLAGPGIVSGPGAFTRENER